MVTWMTRLSRCLGSAGSRDLRARACEVPLPCSERILRELTEERGFWLGSRGRGRDARETRTELTARKSAQLGGRGLRD